MKILVNGNLSFFQLSQQKHFYNYELYDKLFHNISSDPYKFIELKGETHIITPLGRQVASLGFENYIKQQNVDLEVDQHLKTLTIQDFEKTDKRSRNANLISILAIIGTLIIGLVQIYQSYRYNEKGKNETGNTQTISNGNSEINHSNHPSNIIDSTSIKIILDSTNKGK
ncbi:MAG: hypothetical protein K2Q22_15660 [Cytophagales bacterium]|nr:hypothetical protein [Cytophagales bacterium]